MHTVPGEEAIPLNEVPSFSQVQFPERDAAVNVQLMILPAAGGMSGSVLQRDLGGAATASTALNDT